jgi:EAL domain-containing protein (putative c-di-GMP-specific phosphodiesterase class I)
MPDSSLPDIDESRALVTTALHEGAPSIVVQPILRLSTGHAVAYEALSRFNGSLPSFAPDVWFAMAHRCGLGSMFEARAVDLALRAGGDRPAGTRLSVNVSPSVLGAPELHDVLPLDLSGLQFEITEKEVVAEPDRFHAMLEALRRRGARIAVDDVGEGYAGLQLVMSVSPDVLKLDRSLVTGIESQPGKAAMVEAVVRYAAKVGAEVCAEGVENLDDLYVLADLDVAEAQGWVIGMPTPEFSEVSEAARLTCESSFSRALAIGGRADPDQMPATLEHLLGRIVDASDTSSLSQLMPMIGAVLRCDRVELSFLDATGSYLEAVAVEQWTPEGIRYPLNDYVQSRRALELQEMMQVLVSLPESDPKEVEWMLREGIRSIIGVPVVTAGRSIGLLECCRVEEIPWTRMQLRHARIIATVLGPVMTSLQLDRLS